LPGSTARLPLLIGGPRDAPGRQRTLRATLEWSFDLLAPDEQRDLARLAVFAGGCTFEAAEAVCETTLERLSTLVDHQLMLRRVDAQASRYWLLETIREFAAEQLEARGEGDAVRRRHALVYASIAASLGLSVDELGSGGRQRHDLALAEQDNMRAALDWALSEDPMLGLGLAVSLEQFWVATSPREGMQRFEALLERADAAPLKLRARALRDLGGTAEVSGDIERAAAMYEQSLGLFERLGQEKGILRLLHRLGNIARARGDLATARRLAEERLRRARRRPTV
jgi:predicted ATPase